MLVGKSTIEYAVVWGISFFFGYLGLICLLYFYLALSIGGVRAVAHPVSIFIEVIGLIEILWYLCWFLPYRHYLNVKPAVFPPPMTRTQRQDLVARVLEVNADIELFLKGWMCGAPLDDIRQDNIKDWMLWALFDRQGPPGDDEEELMEYIDMFQETYGYDIKPGRGPAKSLTLNFGRFELSHRSLTYYMILGSADIAATITLQLSGFRFYRQPRSAFLTTFPPRPMTLLAPSQSAAPSISYFFRPHNSTKHRPLVIVHGLGAGMLAYLPLLMMLPKNIGVLAVEILPIQSRMTPALPSAVDVMRELGDIIVQQDLQDFVFLGHSYGTFITTLFLRSPLLSSRMHSMILLDPVALLLHLPDVASNFTYRTPVDGNEIELYWAVRTEPDIAYTLRRQFCWREHVLWRDDLLTRKTTIIMGELDCIVNAQKIGSYVMRGDLEATWEEQESWKTRCTFEQWTGLGLEMVYLAGYDHGQGFLSPVMLPKLVNLIARQCEL